MTGSRGFSLLELLIASTVLGLVMGALVAVLSHGQGVFEVRQAEVELRQEARVALDILTREIRVAGYRISNLSEAISSAEVNRLQFVANIDDGDTRPPCDATFEEAADGGVERITYRLDGGVLTRDVDCWDGSTWTAEISGQVVARNLLGAQALFRYFDEDGTEISPGTGSLNAADRGRVRSLTLTIRMQGRERIAPGGGQRPWETLIHHVELHNLR